MSQCVVCVCDDKQMKRLQFILFRCSFCLAFGMERLVFEIVAYVLDNDRR